MLETIYKMDSMKHFELERSVPCSDSSGPIHLRDDAIYIKATMSKGALKIGVPNPSGWLAYLLDDLLFVKRAPYYEGDDYLDRGASSQIYCCSNFIELETLGAKSNLQPGASLYHTESWDIYPKGEWPTEIETLINQFI